MEYISIKETAEKWGISERLVQRYCTEGRIAGAVKFSGAWAIPIDAKKPTDKRKERTHIEREVTHKEETKYIPMPLLNTAFKPGQSMEAIIKIEDKHSRSIAMAEYYYFSGQAEKAAEATEDYLEFEDLALQLSACWINGYANLATGNIQGARFALSQVKKALNEINANTPPQTVAIAVFIATAAAVLLHIPLSQEVPPLEKFVHFLPIGLRIFALYVQAHQAYLNKNYGESIGIVKTALELQPELYVIPTIYLHMVATMDYMSLKDPENAKKHMLEAWNLAKEDYFIEPFAEHHGLLGGMLESVIKKDWPEDFKKIILITYRFSAGWRRVHNPDTGHDVADNLTTTEFVICMLAARDWTNKEIGDHLGISSNTVKYHISESLQKLNITHRKDLKQFMLI